MSHIVEVRGLEKLAKWEVQHKISEISDGKKIKILRVPDSKLWLVALSTPTEGIKDQIFGKIRDFLGVAQWSKAFSVCS